MAKPDKVYMTFAEAMQIWKVSKGRLSQLTRGYKDSRTGKRVPAKLTHGRHWVRKNVEIEAKDRTLEMNMPVLTADGIAFLEENFEKRKVS